MHGFKDAPRREVKSGDRILMIELGAVTTEIGQQAECRRKIQTTTPLVSFAGGSGRGRAVVQLVRMPRPMSTNQVTRLVLGLSNLAAEFSAH